MDAILLVIAWGAGLMSLFLVADMIACDLAHRRAERIDARRLELPVEAEPRRRLRR